MRIMQIDSVPPGSIVERNIYSADGVVLVGHGVELTPRYIERLKSLGVQSMYIYDKRFEDVDVHDVVSERTRSSVSSAVKKIFSKVEQSLQSESDTAVDKGEVRSVASKIVDDLIVSSTDIVNLADLKTYDDYTYQHSVQVCILSILVAMGMGYDENRLKTLAMGVLLRDIGEVMIPPEIKNKPGKLTDEESVEMQKHPSNGFQILQDRADLDPVVTYVALQHHEKLNGRGYPQGLKGDEIHEFSKITIVADIHDAVTSNRIYKGRVAPHKVLNLLAAKSGEEFDPRVVEIFLSKVARYPEGSIVALKTGERAVVLKNVQGELDKPQIRIIADRDGVEIDEPYTIDLSKNDAPKIVRIVEW